MRARLRILRLLLTLTPLFLSAAVSARAQNAASEACARPAAGSLRFIEDNWNLGRLGGTSNDFKAGTINNMFDFSDKDDNGFWSREKAEQHSRVLFLNPSTGEPAHF
jgi:phospholipase C